MQTIRFRFWLMALAVGVMFGCAAKVVSDSASKAGEIGDTVSATGRSITDSAKGIKADVVEVRKAAPPTVAPQIAPAVTRIDNRADSIIVDAAKLDSVSADIATLRQQILDDQAAHEKEVKALQGQITSLSQQIASNAARLVTLALIGAGVAVALGLLMHDMTYAVAGVAGCAVVAGGAMLVGTIAAHLLLVTGIVAGVGALIVGINWIRTGSLASAVKQNWLGQVRAEIDKVVGKVEGVTR